MLFDNVNKVKYALFWFHKNDVLNEAALSQINIVSYQKFIAQETDASSYSCLLDNAILAMIGEDYECTAKNYGKFIESDLFINDFKAQIGFEQNEIDNKTVVRILLNTLSEEYPSVGWCHCFLNIFLEKRFVNML